VESGRASKVPMQPRSRLSDDVTVFQVTNRGCSAEVSASTRLVLLLLTLLGVALLLLRPPLGVELALWRLEVLADEGGEARIRDIAAGFRDVSPVASAASSSAVSSSSSEVVVGDVLYFVQRLSTWARESEGRFSRFETRLSKQYAQWAWVAMACGLDVRREGGGGVEGEQAGLEIVGAKLEEEGKS